jgi:hypothetical protein
MKRAIDSKLRARVAARRLMTVGFPAVLRFGPLSLALVAVLGLAPLVPAEHVHQSEVNGHSHIFVHQHSQLHKIGHVPGDVGRQGVFDHPDDPVLTLSTVFIVPSLHLLAVPDHPLVVTIEPLQPADREALIELIEWPIHGPPHAPRSLRGPPPPVI